MDVHDGLGADGTHTGWEPPGHDESSTSTGEDTHGYDGSDSAGGYEDPTTGSGDAGDSAGGSTAGSAAESGSGSGDTGGAEGPTTITVEVEGQTRELPAEHDYTGDGRPDAAVETGDGRVIVFADTEDNETGAAGPDGKADEAYIVDKQSGQVVGAAHIDPSSGTWVEATGPDAVVADSGVIYADGRAVGLTDTGGESGAGQAAVVDPQTGQGTDVADVDPRTGEWAEGPAATTGSTGDGQDDGGTTGTGAGAQTGTGTTGTAPTGTGTTGTGTIGTGTGTMTVDLGGETQRLPAEKDYTGDGQADAAMETKDGRVIVFSDTENNETGAAGPDGRADEAWIVDKATGRVVGAAHVDPRTGEWVDGAGTDGPSSAPGSSPAAGGSSAPGGSEAGS
jgi:hypothetical protein